jgi:hypothetical protein
LAASAEFKQKVFEAFKRLRDAEKVPQYAVMTEDARGIRIPIVLDYEELETDEILMGTLDEELSESSEPIEDY